MRISDWSSDVCSSDLHDIESLFACAEGGDTLAAAVGKNGIVSLSIDGSFAKELETGPDNLVLRAAELLKRRYGVIFGADITLTKNLPVAAGIGGGSADAAAALRLLTRLWEIGSDAEDKTLLQIAAELGSDVPRSEEHTSELQSLMRISYADFCL